MWQVAPPPQARSQDFILGGGGSEHTNRAKRAPYGVLVQGGGVSTSSARSAEALTFH